MLINKKKIVTDVVQARKQAGSSLIEVLVSIILLSFGLLGMAGLFNFAISSNKNSASRLAASVLVSDFAEVLRANPDGFAAGSYTRAIVNFDPNASVVNDVPTNLCMFPACTNTTIATQDLALFAARVKAYLPAGDFETKRVGTTNQLDIWIVWVEGKGGDAANEKEQNIDNCPTTITAMAPAPDPFPRCVFTRVAL